VVAAVSNPFKAELQGESMETKNPARCVYCERSSNEIPMLKLVYQEQDTWICSQHLPVLLHKPAQLAEKLPGIENVEGAQH
jgi:hypothetical protein